LRSVYVPDHLFILTVSSWTSDGLSLHFLDCSLISEICDIHVTFSWAGISIYCMVKLGEEEILKVCYCSITKLLATPLSRILKITMYGNKTVILLDVLCVCEIWCLTLKTEYKLWVYVNKVLKKILYIWRPK
jgi:hypothetical protein